MSKTLILPISDQTLQKVQAISGLAFSSFLTVHLANQYTAILGPAWYDGVMGGLRKGYQLKFVEPVLIYGSIGLHVAASAILHLRRFLRQRKAASKPTDNSAPTKKQIKVPLHLELHRYSGYVMGTVIVGHILAVRGPSWFAGRDGPADFAFIAESLVKFPYAFHIYYTVFSASAAYHLTYGWFQALKVLLPSSYTSSSPSSVVKSLFRVEKGLGFNVLMIGFLAASLATVAAFGGLLFPLPNKK